MVGIPVQVLAMAEHPEADRLKGVIKSVLLTTDYMPRAIVKRISRAWDCQVFEHYGMTETGLGGGVDCRAHGGYHLRGADLYYEVVDPQSGAPLPPGQEGELVVTTLTRHAMPLIRYRTSDWGRLAAGIRMSLWWSDAALGAGSRTPGQPPSSGRRRAAAHVVFG